MMRRVLAVLGVWLALVAPALGQTGSVSGTVVDESGASVPGATVTLTGPNVRASTTTERTGEYRFTDVAAGTYQISVVLSGFAPATSNVTVGSAAASVPQITLSIASIGEQIVVSASKTESALLDAPATMTVLPGAMLETLPAQNIGDALRMVPGMNVVQLSARDINLTSRQATGTLATSQLALLDGRSIYLDFYGLILWDFVPNNPSDIKQIEVVRGPASVVWGANALSGVVNIITKSPRETPGRTTVTLNAGAFDRDAGSTAGKGAGTMFGVGVSTAQVPNSRLSYRISAGYFNSDPFPRPVGRIPVVTDPRDPAGQKTVGGATYPADATGALGSAFQNSGTSQPKFDVRVDQELANARVTYAGGVAGTEGTIYTGTGPFDIQPGSVMGYGKMNYSRGALKFNVFLNIVNADAPNLLIADPRTGGPIRLDFKNQTFDVELAHTSVVRTRHALTYGGNYRRNNFEITLAPTAENRNEIGAYLQDEIFLDRFRFSLGARVDKFGNIEDPVFSPRLSAIFKPTNEQALRFSFNRAFRSPSTINNYLEQELVSPVDLRALGVTTPFPLLVRAVGSELPIGGTAQPNLKEESVTAYEVAYTGTIGGRTTGEIALYINDVHDEINFVQLPTNRDPYTASNPPPGWQLPASVLALLAQSNIFLPRTAFTYLNLGPLRRRGLELSLDHRFSNALTAFANYSWQDEPEILEADNPYPTAELTIPPTHRFNLGAAYNGPRFLGALTVNYTDDAFWSDVLTSPFHGFTDEFTLVNGSFGVKWRDGTITTTVKSNNLLNKTIQQHVFGDLIRRSVIGEVRFDF